MSCTNNNSVFISRYLLLLLWIPSAVLYLYVSGALADVHVSEFDDLVQDNWHS